MTETKCPKHISIKSIYKNKQAKKQNLLHFQKKTRKTKWHHWYQHWQNLGACLINTRTYIKMKLVSTWIITSHNNNWQRTMQINTPYPSDSSLRISKIAHITQAMIHTTQTRNNNSHLYFYYYLFLSFLAYLVVFLIDETTASVKFGQLPNSTRVFYQV